MILIVRANIGKPHILGVFTITPGYSGIRAFEQLFLHLNKLQKVSEVPYHPGICEYP